MYKCIYNYFQVKFPDGEMRVGGEDETPNNSTLILGCAFCLQYSSEPDVLWLQSRRNTGSKALGISSLSAPPLEGEPY